MWGEFMPQGPRKPIAENDIRPRAMSEEQAVNVLIETPLPTTAGKFSEEEATVWPPAPVVTPDGGFKKSNKNYANAFIKVNKNKYRKNPLLHHLASSVDQLASALVAVAQPIVQRRIERPRKPINQAKMQ